MDKRKPIKAPIVVSNDIAVVTKEQIDDQTHPINIKEMSGKKAGSMVLVKEGEIVTLHIAKGSAPSDTWEAVGSGGGDPVTPDSLGVYTKNQTYSKSEIDAAIEAATAGTHEVTKDQLYMTNRLNFKAHGEPNASEAKTTDYWIPLQEEPRENFELDFLKPNSHLYLYPVFALGGRSAGWIIDNNRNAVVSPVNWKMHDCNTGYTGIQCYLNVDFEGFPDSAKTNYYTVWRERGTSKWKLVIDKFGRYPSWDCTPNGDYGKPCFPDAFTAGKDGVGFPPDHEFQVVMEVRADLGPNSKVYVKESRNTHRQYANLWLNELGSEIDYDPVDGSNDLEHGGGLPPSS